MYLGGDFLVEIFSFVVDFVMMQTEFRSRSRSVIDVKRKILHKRQNLDERVVSQSDPLFWLMHDELQEYVYVYSFSLSLSLSRE